MNELREALRRQPFRPFSVHVADGREFLVEHPDFLLISPTERSFVIAQLTGGYEIIDPMLVTSLSVLEPQGGSGRPA